MNSDFSFDDQDDPTDIEKSVEELIKHGRAFGGAGNHKKALYYFKLALKKDSKNVIALRGKGYALYNLGKYFDAIEDLDKTISIIDKNTVNENRPRTKIEDDVYYKAWNAKGLCYLNLKQYEEALKCYLKVKEIKPQYAVAYMNIAEVFYELGHFSESEHYYDESISISNTVLKSIEQKSLDPNMKEEQERQLRYISWAKIGKAWLFANTNNNKDASDLIDKALAFNKSDSIALNTKGFIIFKKGMKQKNKQYIKKSMEYFKLAQLTAKNDQEKLLPLYHMGIVNLELKKFDIANKYFDEVLKINCRFAEAINGKAIIYNHKGESDKAIDAIREALRYNPSLTAAHENLIKLTLNLGDGRKSFWNFWNASWTKRIAAIVLGMAAFSIIMYPISQYNEDITTTKSYGNNSTNGNYNGTTITTTSPQLKIDNSYLIVFGIIIFILLLPEIQRAKIGGIIELETSNQPLPIAKSSL